MDQKPLSSSTKATEMKDWEEIGYHPRDVNENELHREARGGKSPSSPGAGGRTGEGVRRERNGGRCPARTGNPLRGLTLRKPEGPRRRSACPTCSPGG